MGQSGVTCVMGHLLKRVRRGSRPPDRCRTGDARLKAWVTDDQSEIVASPGNYWIGPINCTSLPICNLTLSPRPWATARASARRSGLISFKPSSVGRSDLTM